MLTRKKNMKKNIEEMKRSQLPFGASHTPSFLLIQFQFVIGLLLILCKHIAAFISWTGGDPFGMVDVLISTYHLLNKGWKCRRDFCQFREHFRKLRVLCLWWLLDDLECTTGFALSKRFFFCCSSCFPAKMTPFLLLLLIF